MSSILKKVEREKAKGTFGKTAEDPSHCLQLCWLYSANGIMYRVLSLLLLSRFSRVRLCDPIDGSPPGSPIPGILQARTLEWVAISFSNAWKWKVKVKSLSRVSLSDPMDCSPPGSSVHGIFQARVLEWVQGRLKSTLGSSSQTVCSQAGREDYL